MFTEHMLNVENCRKRKGSYGSDSDGDTRCVSMLQYDPEHRGTQCEVPDSFQQVLLGRMLWGLQAQGGSS